MIQMTLKDGIIYKLDDNGNVLDRSDGPRGWNYSGRWTIIGFLRRWNSRKMIPLQAALNGADIGHGYVVDLDGGSMRVWMSPSNHRVSRLERV